MHTPRKGWGEWWGHTFVKRKRLKQTEKRERHTLKAS